MPLEENGKNKITCLASPGIRVCQPAFTNSFGGNEMMALMCTDN